MLQEAGHLKNIYYIVDYSCFDFPAHSVFTFDEF